MMSLDDASLGVSAKLLTEYASGLLQMSTLLTGSLGGYRGLAECAVADILELLSAITAELNVQGLDAIGTEMANQMMADEPTSFLDAVAKLPAFLVYASSAVGALSVSSGSELTCVSVRAQTFAFHFRQAPEIDKAT